MSGQIKINSKKSYDDFNFKITQLELGIPSPSLVLETVPFKIGVWDFTDASNTQYSTRELKVTFEYDKYEVKTSNLYYIYMNFINWLYTTSHMSDIEVDNIAGVLVGRVSSVSDFNVFDENLTIEVTFTCQPLRRICDEEDDLWDNLDFNNSYIQDYYYTVKSSREERILLHSLNTSSVYPKLFIGGNVTIRKDDVSYAFTHGTYENVFSLQNGENYLYLSGYGSVSFAWAREVI